jgi:solute carrier family 25 phosphate transporter 23/24/25/41
MSERGGGPAETPLLARASAVSFLQERAVQHDLVKLCSLSSFANTTTLLDNDKLAFSSDEIEELLFLAKLVDMFEEVDKDSSGSIDKSEIISTMLKLGYKVTPRQGDMMLKKVDTDGNNEISLIEFVTFFRNSPLDSINALAEQWADSVVTDFGGELSPSLPPSGLEVWQTVVAGGCGGVASRTLTAPLEKVKLAAQTGTSRTAGVYRELAHIIVATQGVKGLFAGNFMNCIRVFPTAGIACTCYLNLLKMTPADEEFDMMEPVYRLACGGAAALIANTLTYPMDIIRVRLTLADSPVSVYYHYIFCF